MEITNGLQERDEKRRIHKETQNAPNVLIIDDDIDSAVLVESIFANLGCTTMCSLDSNDAKKKLFSARADIIILDWMLDRNTRADILVNSCTSTFRKFGDHVKNHRPKIITFSSLEQNEIGILHNPYFDHVEHWHKPLGRKDLLLRALCVLALNRG